MVPAIRPPICCFASSLVARSVPGCDLSLSHKPDFSLNGFSLTAVAGYGW